jgi:hypothetical protein
MFLFISKSEHLCSAGWADSLGSGFTVFHGDAFGVLHFFLGTALHEIRILTSLTLVSKAE